ncbi:MAG: tetratricopeptide repeat protein [Paracoccus denitrificans]|uniref:Tetratricopeptide repeat protein n=1 Tax=Paracoccus denitrificans TaxID=266 RepID=A0A533I8S2_PARDE|nr:MAG: tetratricopeptide repeat protein [Paracoccus denitrificans]
MKLIHSLALACLIALPASGPIMAQDDTPPPPRPEQLFGDRSEDVPDAPPAPLTRGLAGPYLAARSAAIENEFSSAADYFLRAMKQDQNSAYLADSALLTLLAAGEFDRAVELTTQRSFSGPMASRLAELVKRAEAAHNQDWSGLLALVDETAATDDGTEQLLDGMLRAWALLGEGKASEAEAAFEGMRGIQGAEGLVNYHLGLAKALVGDFEAAATLLHSDAPQENIMTAIVEARVLAQLDRREDALEVLRAVEGLGIDGVAEELARQLQAGEPVEFDTVKDPRDGIAQVFLTFATLLINDVEPNPMSLIHARSASYIAPDMVDARLMVAQMLQAMGQFDEAEVQFDMLREQGEMRPTAELLRIDALARSDHMADAEKAAMALTATRPELPQGWVALGDLMRSQEKWPQAVPAYDKALELIDPSDEEERWFPLYARAIALERLGQFDRAETDLKAALEIRPDNAQLLNYLGYSYVDRGQNMDEALRLIERAVELSPDDGYILDSLGWVLYRLGRYDEAVAPQERAVAAMASDPLVNDHLGDIYWKVGREREAEIQWMRALSFQPETEDEIRRIRAKLDRGLDAVLAEEEANGGQLPMPPEDIEPPEAVPPAE